MRKMIILLAVLVLVPAMLSVSEARRSMLDEVNATCGANYGCGLCHVDPRGGGALTSGGTGYRNSGYDPCYFCDTVCNPPAVQEICDNGIDDDGDRKIDCADSDCSNDPACVQVCIPTQEGKGRTCSDGKDNDCDGLTDCADPNCARNQSCKTR